MRMLGIRRYPVKAMGGEQLTRVEIDTRGLLGDRWYAVTDADGKLAAGKNTRRFRRHDEIFGWTARTDGERVLAGFGSREWALGPELDAELSSQTGQEMRVLAEDSLDRVSHYDDGAVSLIGSATLSKISADTGVDTDQRRVRANIVVATETPFEEEEWVGEQVSIGGVRLRIEMRLPRCRVLDQAQDGVSPSSLLVPLGRLREARLAVVGSVIRPGMISIGDRVEVCS